MSEKHKNLSLYIGLLVAVISGCLPDMSMQGLSTILVFVVLTVGYFFRARAKQDDLVWHHATFVIRTVWIWSIFAIIGMIGAGYQIYSQGDASMIDAFMSQVMNGLIPTDADIQNVSDSYMAANENLMIAATLIWIAPAQVYALWRTYKGLSRALAGYRVQNLYGWF